MKRLLKYLFYFQVSLLKLEGHQSVLIDICNADKVSIKNSFDNAKIKNSLPFESSGTRGDNCDGIFCFATYSGFAKDVREGKEEIRNNPNPGGDIPRCHSEVFLLKALENDYMVSLLNEDEPLILENTSIIIQNRGKCNLHNKFN